MKNKVKIYKFWIKIEIFITSRKMRICSITYPQKKFKFLTFC